MGVPLFESRELIRKHGIAVFSSNYHLYGDMSMRVMDTLRLLADHSTYSCVEVYSVDEAFINLSHLPTHALQGFAERLRDVVVQWTGIPVSVGIAPSKVLSKVANRLAKKDKVKSHCVMVLDAEDKLQEALETTDVADLWGIGRKYARKLKDLYGINTAWQLKHMPEEWARKNLGGVVGVRMIRELNGLSCIQMKDPLEKKKMIATTRMFGKPVYELKELKEAVATYVSRAAEKLRRQYSAASSIDVFVVTNGQQGGQYAYDPQHHHRYFTMMKPTSDTAELIRVALPLVESLYRKGAKYAKAGVMLGGIVPDDALQGGQYAYDPQHHHRYFTMMKPTSDTAELIRVALPLVESLYRKGAKYAKAGVMLGGIVPDDALQGDLFAAQTKQQNRALMQALDNINFSMRDDMVKFVSSGLTRNWKMRQEMRSGRYTTRWDEVYQLKPS